MQTTLTGILEEVLEREGWPKYTEHPFDKGGPTKGGITIRTLESWRQRRVTRQELQRLKKPEAMDIMKRLYAESNGIQRLEGHHIQPQVVDNAILSGPSLAVKDLQRVLNVTEDGICGAKTMHAVEGRSPEELSHALAVRRALRLARFAVKNPEQMVFLVGWLTRALGFVHDNDKSSYMSDMSPVKS